MLVLCTASSPLPSVTRGAARIVSDNRPVLDTCSRWRIATPCMCYRALPRGSLHLRPFPVILWCCCSVLCSYEGEWKDDMKWGFGKAIYRKKAHYEGHFYKDKRHGFGRMWYANAGTYEVC